MQGKIIKGIAGFYYVRIAGSGVYECKAKGIFRKENRKPLVGDNVEIAVLDEADKEGNLEAILPRKNELIRPAAANVDQALVVFAAAKPEPHFQLLDRFLVMMERKGIPAILCFNKKDLVDAERQEELKAIYKNSGYPVLFASAARKEKIGELKEQLLGKTTVIAGPSGVGKSSLINLLSPEAEMETGAVSKKIGRGRHTTRHSELLALDGTSYIMDTPGFSSFYVDGMEKEELKSCFREFFPYEGKCRFHGCDHIHEPDCAVKEAAKRGDIHKIRYQDYRELYEEIQNKRRY